MEVGVEMGLPFFFLVWGVLVWNDSNGLGDEGRWQFLEWVRWWFLMLKVNVNLSLLLLVYFFWLGIGVADSGA